MKTIDPNIKLRFGLTESKWLHFLTFFLCLIPVLVYTWMILKLSINAPFYDDFYWAFEYINDYLKAATFREKLAIIFEQFNQHRIIYAKLMMLAVFKFTGEVNFRTYTLIGNISLYLTFLIYILYVIKNRLSVIALIPVAYLIFNLTFYHNSVLTYGLPNMSVILFALLSFYLVNRGVYSVAMFAGTLAAFSNGNGLIVLPIIAFLLLIKGERKWFFWTVFSTVIVVYIYFFNYAFDTNEIKLNQKTLLFFVNFLGGFYKAEKSSILQVLTGISIVTLISVCAWMSFKRKQYSDFLLGSALFILGSAAKAALVRSQFIQSIPSWYNQYSLLMYITLCLALLASFRNQKKILLALWLGFLAVAGVTKVLSYKNNIANAFHLKSNLEADLMNYSNHGKWSLITPQVGHKNYLRFNSITEDFIESGIFLLRNPLVTPIDTHHIDSFFHIDTLSNPYRSVLVKNDIQVEGKDKSYYAALINNTNQKTYFLGTFPRHGLGNILRFGKDQVHRPTMFILNSYFFKEAIEAGEYSLGILGQSQEKSILFMSNQKVHVRNL
ncbi:MAG: hypothetical protein NXI00_05240 [Cytophagales bacterium]|nr:hypothetical protein [Cytophagales bacterium]